LRVKVYAEAEGYELICITSPTLPLHGGVYISAGIHGDEPASTEGLLFWAETHHLQLRTLPLLLFPCLNPWGLAHNIRTDSEQRDLNRCYHLDELPRIAAQKAILANRTFRICMTLHEDYDAQGIYLYELCLRGAALGPELLSTGGKYISPDLRKTIDGRRSAEGLIRRRFRKWKLPFLPEAAYLALHHSAHAVTFETPSEYDLALRVQTQAAVVQAMLQKKLAE
jgi:hypothetical protein